LLADLRLSTDEDPFAERFLGCSHYGVCLAVVGSLAHVVREDAKSAFKALGHVLGVLYKYTLFFLSLFNLTAPRSAESSDRILWNCRVGLLYDNASDKRWLESGCSRKLGGQMKCWLSYLP
jgi:hypothetical protein